MACMKKIESSHGLPRSIPKSTIIDICILDLFLIPSIPTLFFDLWDDVSGWLTTFYQCTSLTWAWFGTLHIRMILLDFITYVLIRCQQINHFRHDLFENHIYKNVLVGVYLSFMNFTRYIYIYIYNFQTKILC